MHKLYSIFRNKKIISLIIIFFFIILIIILSYLILNPSTQKTQNDELANFLQQNANKKYIPKFKLNSALNSLKNKNAKAENQYKEVASLGYYVQDVYFKSNFPEVREYLTELNDKVKKRFPKYHNENDFLVACADPKCGDKPDAEMLEFLTTIQNLEIKNLYKSIIITNLKVSFYIPYDTVNNKLEKFTNFILVRNQLLSLNNAEASQSAQVFTDYIKKKYNYDLTRPNIFPSDL